MINSEQYVSQCAEPSILVPLGVDNLRILQHILRFAHFLP